MRLFRFEHHTQAVAPHGVFLSRLIGNIAMAALIIAGALGIGMAGYRATEHMSWIDAFLNAAMLLGGMGPVGTLETDAGKLFAGLYALACGLLFVLVTGIVLAPVLHRVLHALKVEDQ
ncbi:MAG: hypothetical protein AB7O04_04000 [Hyphomonadaceae bacterium]